MKPVLFIDFIGTLCDGRFWVSLDNDDYGRIDKFLFNDGELFNGWMRGDYNSEKICEILSRELRIEYEILWDALLADCRAMRVFAADLRKIGLLRKDYITAIVTVNMDCFDRFIVPALGLDKYFDCIVNSCNEGVFKYWDVDKGNKGGLLEVALSRTGADINRSILIDDSEKACAEFKKIGGCALRVDGLKTASYWLDNLIK
jgi:FMN phosphatase YigB (HAD superfamily)